MTGGKSPSLQKVKRKRKTGSEQHRSVVIGSPKSVINKSKLGELYEVDRRHARAVNEWIEKWYWRLDMVERILTGSATTLMQQESIEAPVLSAYAQIAGNRMLDILREHYLAVQDKLTTDIWKNKSQPPDYKLVYSAAVRNHTLFARFVSGDFSMEDVVARWAGSGSEYLRRRIKATVSTEIGQAVNLLISDLQDAPGTLVIFEDLSELDAQGAKRSTRGRFDLSVWARGELQNHLRQDLEWLGGSIDHAIPEYSSQQCAKCGYVDKKNRSGKVFRCGRCGHTEDADVNAAKNIRKCFSDADLCEIARKYCWNKELRRQKIWELLLQRANQAA